MKGNKVDRVSPLWSAGLVTFAHASPGLAQSGEAEVGLGLLGILAASLVLVLVLFSNQSLRARRQARELQVHAEALSSRLRAVMDAADSGIMGFGRDGRIAVANPKALHLLGVSDRSPPFEWPEEIKFFDAKNMTPFGPGEGPIDGVLNGHALGSEAVIMTRSASLEPRYVRLSSASLDEKASPDIGLVVIFDDVSEQERSRQQVERSSRLDALGQLTGGIAHDFNNLLATIEYAIQLAETTEDDDARTNYHRTALTSVARGASLTNRLLAFAKRQPGRAKAVAVADILAEFAELARPTIEENIEFIFDSDEAELWVYCDTAQFENALLNLVLNSRDAMMRSGQGDKITITARGIAQSDRLEDLPKLSPEDSYSDIWHNGQSVSANAGTIQRFVEVDVSDNGPGMTPDVKARAIDPFFTTKDRTGSGLGLSMVYGFVQQSGGEMQILSEPGEGTTVRMRLPRGTEKGGRERPIEQLPMPRGQGETILIVEDEPELLKMMRDIARSLGYEVELASNGEDALKFVTESANLDLLLTDVVMPGGLGGFDLARLARNVRPDLPVIYMSGYTGFSKEEMGAVVAPLIQKPSPPGVVARAISEAITASA